MKAIRTLTIPALLLAGCTLSGGPNLGGTPGGNASLTLQPQVQGGGLHTQDLVAGYSSSDINHLQIKLFKVASGSETPMVGPGGSPMVLDLPQASLSFHVTVGNLAPDTTYRVRGYAYSDAGTANPISLDASSSVDVTVGRDDRPTLANLPVCLIGGVFNGQATASNIVVTGGELTHTGSESMGTGS